MTAAGYIYCAVLGACNFLILRVILTVGLKQALLENIRDPGIRLGATTGIVATLAGGIAHRTLGFDPDTTDPWSWALVFVGPLILAFLTSPKLDPGWSSLQRGKALWQSLPVELPVGSINPAANEFKNHSKVTSAAALIRAAIDDAPRSDADPIGAQANAALAWQELGLLYRVINEFDEARRCFERSLALLDAVDKSSSRNRRVLNARRETLFRLAELDQVLGNQKMARARYKESLDIDALLGHDDPVGETTTRNLLAKL